MSIKHLFRNITFWLVVLLFLVALIGYSLFSMQYNLNKIEHLNQLKAWSQKLKCDPTGEPTVAKLKLQDRLNIITNHLLQLVHEDRYDYLQRYHLDKSTLTKAHQTLQMYANALSIAAHEHLQLATTESLSELTLAQQRFEYALHDVSEAHLLLIGEKNRLYLYFALSTALFVLLLLLWYARKLGLVYGDIEMLLSVDKERIKELRTLEGSAIQRRVSKGGVALNSKSLLDPQTQLPNEKGLLNEFAHREGNVQEILGVAYYDIDNLKELEMRHGKPFTDDVIKKFAFLLSLEKKPSDSIARVGDDEFVFIIARKEQDSSYAQATALIKSFEKTPFRTPKGEKIFVTASGGFALKDPFEKLDNALKSAQTLLKRAKLQGKNNVTKLHNFDRDREQRI